MKGKPGIGSLRSRVDVFWAAGGVGVPCFGGKGEHAVKHRQGQLFKATDGVRLLHAQISWCLRDEDIVDAAEAGQSMSRI